jgi:hypothetical protein
MPSKKKKKPSFEVPEDVREAGQAEWVYRSDQKPAEAFEPGAPAIDVPVTRTVEVKRAPAHVPHRTRAEESTKSHSKSSAKKKSGILDLTVKTFSSGFSTVANATLLGSRIALAPFRLGARMIGRISS